MTGAGNKICLLHGYLLEGSGSNLWTRAIVQALCQIGDTVHLVCQENHPDEYDFIASARTYASDGEITVLFERETGYPGTCVLHKPILGDTLPVYVHDRYEEFSNVVPMVDLPDDAIDAYLTRNVDVVARVIADHGVTAIHANHAVLMSVVAERVGRANGVPYAVMPHGSAIEYAVKKQARFHTLAQGAFRAAGRIFAVGGEMHRRVIDLFPDLVDLDDKVMELNLGVDTGAFHLVSKDHRAPEISTMVTALETIERGKPRDSKARMIAQITGAISCDDLRTVISGERHYLEKLPDEAVDAKLGQIDWGQDEILLFVGRLIASKGPQNIIAALPLIFDARPEARMVVVGHGPLREVLECFLWSLEHGERSLVETIVAAGESLVGGAASPFEEIKRFFGALEERNELDAYFATAKRTVRSDRVIFTGYLTHRELKHLFPSCDVAVFPSVVAEAGPLVFLEALASGCFPLGTYFAGMAASIDSVAGALSKGDAEIMKLRNDPAHTVSDIASKTIAAFSLEGRYKATLRGAVVARFDWASVARKLSGEMSELARTKPD